MNSLLLTPPRPRLLRTATAPGHPMHGDPLRQLVQQLGHRRGPTPAQVRPPRRWDGHHHPRVDFRDGIRQVIYHKLLKHYQLTQQADRVMDLAQKILLLDQKDPAALQAVSVFDLRAMFASASPNLSVVSSPARPIQIQRFTMPQSGDWGDAVVMQTPAQLIYHLTLPANPVEFQARI